MLRPVLFLLFLIGGGSVAWFALNGEAPPAAPPPPQTVKILVATQPLQAGTLLKDVDFKEQDVEPGKVPDGTFVADDNTRAEVRGSMLRRYLDAGEPVRRPDILRPRDRGFLAAVLAPGTRAVSIGVDATTGASGLISPGDLVDVVLTQEFSRGETPVGRRVVAETVLAKVRVIAVDQQIAQGGSANIVPASNAARIANTVSLEVTPEQAAKIVVAGRLGRLTLLVRSIEGDTPALAQAGSPQTGSSQASAPQAGAPQPGSPAAPVRLAEKPPGSVFGSDVSSALSQDEPAAARGLRLIQGDAVNDVTFR